MMKKKAKIILSLLKKDNDLTTKRISEIINKSSRNVQRTLDSLKNKGLIQRVGSNKKGYWKVNM